MTIKIAEVLITKDVAEEYLRKNTGNFRTLNASRVRRYQMDMESGRWGFSGDPIRFDTNGILIDGQHRLHAIVKSNVSVMMVVITGLEPESAMTIDKGQPRGTQAWLRHSGMKNSNNISSIAKQCLMHRKNAWHVVAFGTAYCSDSEIIEFASKYETTLQAAYAMAATAGRVSGVTASLLAAIMHEAAYPNHAESIELCKWFCDGLRSGIGYSKSDAVYHLRERMMVKHSTQKESPYMIRMISTIAWNKTADGIPTKTLRFNPTGPHQTEPQTRIRNLSGFSFK